MRNTKRLATGAALLTVAAVMLTGCASGGTTASSSGTAAASEPTTIRFALDWTPNTNHTGLYEAIAKGYFADAGLNVEVLPYNGSYPETLIDAGAADFGIGFQDVTTFSMAAGADVQSVMAPIQKWVTAIGVRADNTAVNSPKDLDGKTYAGFGSPSEVPTLSQVIKNDGGTGEFNTVTLGTSAYEALYSGNVDFTVPFKTWEGIQADLNGTPMKYFDYSDYGFPEDYGLLILGNKTWMGENPDVTKKFVQALAHGYQDAIDDPDAAAQVLIDANPTVLTEPDLVKKSQEMLSSTYMLDKDGKFGLQTEEQWAGLGGFYLKAGLLADANGTPLTTAPDWSSFFTNDYMTQ
ncbi:ABC transporter substrate-binding protein [soil metagenome]